jgi:hypothetical protein
VLGLDIDDDEYESFDLLFAGLKANRGVLCSILWDDQFFMTQNYQPNTVTTIIMQPQQQQPQMGQMMGNPMLGQMMNQMAIQPMQQMQQPMPVDGMAMMQQQQMNQQIGQQIGQQMDEQMQQQMQQQMMEMALMPPPPPPPPPPPSMQTDPFMVNYWSSNPFSWNTGGQDLNGSSSNLVYPR